MISPKNIGKHFSYDFKSFKEIINGIVLNQSEDWTLLIDNCVDYDCDGFSLIYNPAVDRYKRNKHNRWKEKIILLKTKHIKSPKIKVTDTITLFKSLKRLNKVISISNKKDDIIWVGKIIELLDDRVIIKTLTSRAKWVGKQTVMFKDLTLIQFDTDYINSLLLVAN
jgi:hypothetical protein